MKRSSMFLKEFLRLIVLFLVVAMVCPIFIGCGAARKQVDTQSTSAGQQDSSTQGTAKPKLLVSDEPVEFSMMYSDNSTYPFNENWPILLEIKKRTNVTLKIMTVPDSDKDQKYKIMLNTGDLPDIICGIAPGEYTDFAMNGIFIAASEYLDKLPNLRELMSKWNFKQDWDNYKLADGKVYYFPGVREKPIYDQGICIRTDLLKKYNLDTPKTFDDLYSVMKKFKEADPKSLPFTGEFGIDCTLNFIGNAWGLDIGSWSAGNQVYYDTDTKKFESTMTSPKYQKLLVYLSKLYMEGLMDPEIFTQNMDQWKQKLVIGKSFVSYNWFDQYEGIDADGKKNTDQDFAYEPILPLAGPEGKALSATFGKMAAGVTVPSKTANKDYFDNLLKFIDWFFYSEEGYTLSSWGIENDTYTVADGKKTFTDAVKTTDGISKTLSVKYGCLNNNFTLAKSLDFQLAITGDKIVQLTNDAIAGNMLPPSKPIAKLTADENEQVKLLIAPLKDFFDKSLQAFILGKKDPVKDWDVYVKEAQDKGIQKVVNIYNMALQRQAK